MPSARVGAFRARSAGEKSVDISERSSGAGNLGSAGTSCYEGSGDRPASITCARVRRQQVGLVRPALPVLCIWRRLTFYGDVRPDQSIFGIDSEPFFESGLRVRLDRIDRAFRLANTAID